MPPLLSEDHFATYFRRYNTRLLTFLSARLLPAERDQGEDIVSEAWLKAWKFRAQFEARNGSSFFTWLTRIAINVLLVRRRDRHLHKNFAVFVSVEEIVNSNDDPRAAADVSEESLHAKGQLRGILDSLKPRDKDWFRLVFQEENSIREASTATGLSILTIKGRTFQIRKRLLEKKF